MDMEKCPICYGRQISEDNVCLRCQAKLQPLMLINQQVSQCSNQVFELIKKEDYAAAWKMIQQIKIYKNSDFWCSFERFLNWKIQRRDDGRETIAPFHWWYC